jgi:hypothetical protein
MIRKATLIGFLSLAVLTLVFIVPTRGTLQTANGLWWPEPMVASVGGTVFIGGTLDAAADRISFVFRCPKAGNLGYVGFRTGTVTTSEALKISFQTIDPATGNPDDTVDEYRVFDPAPYVANTFYLGTTVGLLTSDGTGTGAKRAVARGEYVGVAIQFNAFSAGNMQIAKIQCPAVSTAGIGRFQNLLAYVTENLTGAYAKSLYYFPDLYIQYDDGSTAYMPAVWPFSAATSTTFKSDSATAEHGLRFQTSFAAKGGGLWQVQTATTTGEYNLVLYGSNGTTVLGTCTGDKDIRLSTYGYGYCWLPAEVTLSAATTYFIGICPTTTTTTDVSTWTVPAVGAWDQTSCGQACYSVSRAVQGTGAWTETTTTRPLLGVIITALDDGATTGGGGTGRVVSQ